MKKFIGLLVSLGIVLSLGGCDLLDSFSKGEARVDYNTNEETEKEPEIKKISNKTIHCVGSLEEEGFTMGEEINVNFENDRATTVNFAFIYDFGIDENELSELLESFDFEGEIIKAFEEKGITSSQFTTKAEQVDGNKVRVDIDGRYIDLVNAFTETGDVDARYHNTSYNNVNKLLQEEAKDNNLTCTTEES